MDKVENEYLGVKKTSMDSYQGMQAETGHGKMRVKKGGEGHLVGAGLRNVGGWYTRTPKEEKKPMKKKKGNKRKCTYPWRTKTNQRNGGPGHPQGNADKKKKRRKMTAAREPGYVRPMRNCRDTIELKGDKKKKGGAGNKEGLFKIVK